MWHSQLFYISNNFKHALFIKFRLMSQIAGITHSFDALYSFSSWILDTFFFSSFISEIVAYHLKQSQIAQTLTLGNVYHLAYFSLKFTPRIFTSFLRYHLFISTPSSPSGPFFFSNWLKVKSYQHVSFLCTLLLESVILYDLRDPLSFFGRCHPLHLSVCCFTVKDFI